MAVNSGFPNGGASLDGGAGYRLPCGVDADAVWEDLHQERAGAHDDSCADCAGARAGLGRLMAATRLLVQDPVEPPPGLLSSIMSTVRMEFRRGETLPLAADDPGLGPAQVSEAAVAVVLRFAVDTVPGVRARSCRITAEGGPPGSVDVRLSLSLRYPQPPEDELFDRIRTLIHRTLSDRVGLRAAVIDLAVVDVWTER